MDWCALRQADSDQLDGLVTRIVTPTIPPRVDYELTALGQTLQEPVRILAEWAQTHRPAIQTAQAKFDALNAKAPKDKAA